MEARGPSGASAARAAMRSRIGHPSSIRVDELQLNPLNPRYDEDDPEVRELAETLKQVGQLQPALVVSREQFLRAYPDQRTAIGAEPWVVIVGNRRLVASRLAGRAALDVRVDAELDSAEEVEDRVLIENIQRKDLPPLLEAVHLQRRLARSGQTVRSVGDAIGKSHTYVQQRIDLLRMIPEFQEMFRRGSINVKTGRQLGTVTEEHQREVLAAGPPYAVTRPKPRGALGVNPVAIAPLSSDPGPASPAPQADPDPGRTASSEDASATAGAISTSPSSTPLSSYQPDPDQDVDHAAVIAGATDRDARAGSPLVQPRPSSPVIHPDSDHDGEDAMESTRASVSRWLDNALVDLDHVLPDGANGATTEAFREVRRCIHDARAALERSASPPAS